MIVKPRQLQTKNYHLLNKIVLSLFVLTCPLFTVAQDSFQLDKQRAFESVFGSAAILDPVMLEKVKGDTPGKRHYLDADNDGKPEEVWFIDTDARHNDRNRPILVRVIDENNNLAFGKEPDKFGDLWVADWHADGLVDAVIGYEDTDSDGDLDQMGMYFVDRRNGLRVWWFIDDGDDNLLGYDVDYYYYQIPCQDHTHFGGNESLISMYFDPEKKIWTPFWENPFLFYDDDQDGITEEVVRIEGEDDIMRFLRWSFNVNPREGELRNYDVGITACAPGWSITKNRNSDFSFRLADDQTETFQVRGFPTGPVVKRSTARESLQAIEWTRVLMTWDEIDLNTAWNRPGDKIERWEGIISAGYKEPGYYMPQVGGPDCGPYNKRYELVTDPVAQNSFYFNPSDKKIHIRGSSKTWINVDFNGDLKTDMYYHWRDRDLDGIVERLEIDLDGDGVVDDSFDLHTSDISVIGWNFTDFNKVHVPVLENEPENKYYLIQALFDALQKEGAGNVTDAVWAFLQNRLRGESYSDELAERMIVSDESVLYYLMLVQDRLIGQLKRNTDNNQSFWKRFNRARSAGDTRRMTKEVNRTFNTEDPAVEYETWVNGLRAKEEKQRVAWDNQWLPPNWGWESEKVAFRFYDGHFDLYGKRLDTLIYPRINEGKNYHKDINKWGMDILHVGQTSGVGGLTLYVNGEAFPVRNEKQPGDPVFISELIEETSNQVTLEFVTKGIGPGNYPYTIRIRPSIRTEESVSDVRVFVEGGRVGDRVELGIGLTRLEEESFYCDNERGYMANWGIQEPEIGWIGMGILFDREKYVRVENDKQEHRVVLQYRKDKPFIYQIKGMWLKGERFPISVSPNDWFKRFEKLTNL